MTEEKRRRASSTDQLPQHGIEGNNKTSPNRSVTCTVETVTNMASNDPEAEVGVEPRGSTQSDDHRKYYLGKISFFFPHECLHIICSYFIFATFSSPSVIN